MNEPVNEPNETKLDPDKMPTLEELAAINFANEPAAIKKLKEELRCVACGSLSHITSLCPTNNAAMSGDPFRTLYVLTYKGNGPIEHVFFRSTKVMPLIVRDCQVWCKARSLRYISFKPALVNLANLEGDPMSQVAPAGDITELVTRQSVEQNRAAEAASKQQQ